MAHSKKRLLLSLKAKTVSFLRTLTAPQFSVQPVEGLIEDDGIKHRHDSELSTRTCSPIIIPVLPSDYEVKRLETQTNLGQIQGESGLCTLDK